MSIKSSGPIPLQAHLDLRVGSRCLSSAVVTLVHPAHVRPARDGDPLQLGAIVFPRYQPAAQVRLAALGRAKAGLYLMECLLNAHNLAEHGFSAVAELTRCIASYELTFGGLNQLDPVLQDLQRSTIGLAKGTPETR